MGHLLILSFHIMANMKTLTKISATAVETDFREPHCHHHTIGQSHQVPTFDGKHANYSRVMRVGPAGIIFTNGKQSLVIPEAELWAIAERHEPGLAVPSGVAAMTAAPGSAGVSPASPNSKPKTSNPKLS